MNEEISLRDLPPAVKRCGLALFLAVSVTGFIEHESVSVMQATAEASSYCARFDANGRTLISSMVMETYIKGAVKPHECNYAYRSPL